MANFLRSLRGRRESPFQTDLAVNSDGDVSVVKELGSPLRKKNDEPAPKARRKSRRERRPTSPRTEPAVPVAAAPSPAKSERKAGSRRTRATTTIENVRTNLVPALSSRFRAGGEADAAAKPAGGSLEVDVIEQPRIPAESWLRCFDMEKDRYEFVWWGDRVRIPTPFPHGDSIRIKQLALGGRHFLLLSESGKVYSWGDGSSGQLGHGSTQAVESPTLIKALEGLIVSQVHSIAAQSAALTNTGALYTWGWTGSREMNTTPSIVDALRGRRVKCVALGAYHTAVLLAPAESGQGVQVCTWGTGAKGQLGHGDLEDRTEPQPVAALERVDVAALYSGETYMVAVTTEGRAFVWGSNERGVLGVDETKAIIDTPKVIPGLARVVTVTCGLSSMAAITHTGVVYTWGKNSEGQLGLDCTDEYVLDPQQVLGLAGQRVVGVAGGNNYMVAWTDTGTTFSWGSNRNNRLGLASEEPFIGKPTALPPLAGRGLLEVACTSRTIVACVGKQLFGVPLAETLAGHESLPGLVRECLSYLQGHLGHEGLFRIAADQAEKKQLVAWWNSGYYVNMSDAPGPDVIASLLKHFLISLPDPLMTFALYEQIIAVRKDPLDALHRLESFRSVLKKLSAPNLALLEALFGLLSQVMDHRSQSLMDARNLATVFAPAIFRPPPEQVELARDIQVQISLTKKLVKYYRAVLAPHSSAMLTEAARVLVDENATPQELQINQRRHWHAWAKNLMDPSASFVAADGSSCAFAQVLCESEAIDLSIQSAILQYPLPEALPYLEQLLSLLSDVPCSTVVNLIEGLNYVQLTQPPRASFGGLLASFKDLSSLSEAAPSSAIDWLAVPPTNFPMEDEDIKAQLLATERAALALRQVEQARAPRAAPAPREPAPPPTEVIGFFNKQRDRYETELARMLRDREDAAAGNEAQPDPQGREVAKGLRTLDSEHDALTEQRAAMQSQLEVLEEQLAQCAQESSLEHQRYKDELEELDSNIEHKAAALTVSTSAKAAFAEFLKGPFDSNHQRLMAMKRDMEEAILCNTSACPALIQRYLEASQSAFGELRRRLKQARKDMKHMEKSYGQEAAAAIEGEYQRLLELFQEVVVEFEEAGMIYQAILQPVRGWMEFCDSSGIQPNQPEALEDFIAHARLNPTVIMRQFLYNLLAAFGFFPEGPGAAAPVGELFSRVLAAVKTNEDHIEAIQKRHHVNSS